MVRRTEASQFRQGAPHPAFTGHTVLFQGTPTAGLQADSHHGRICLARRQHDCSCCCERMLYPGWLCCHQRFPGWAGQLPAAAGNLPATSSLQVSASGGSSLTLSQNFSLCQGCSLVHSLACTSRAAGPLPDEFSRTDAKYVIALFTWPKRWLS